MKSNNFPYEQQQLKTSFPPYKNRKNKTNRIPTFHSISPPFCHVLTKTTQTKSKLKTYATNVRRN